MRSRRSWVVSDISSPANVMLRGISGDTAMLCSFLSPNPLALSWHVEALDNAIAMHIVAVMAKSVDVAFIFIVYMLLWIAVYVLVSLFSPSYQKACKCSSFLVKYQVSFIDLHRFFLFLCKILRVVPVSFF